MSTVLSYVEYTIDVIKSPARLKKSTFAQRSSDETGRDIGDDQR
jgi:hypothetical protein